MDNQMKSETQDINYAGFLIRLMAKLSDNLILFFPTLVYFSFVNIGQIDLKGLIVVLIWYILIFWLLGWIISVLYYSYLTFRYGGTIGKMIAGISVFDEKASKLTFAMSLFRHTIGYASSGIFFGLGYLWIIKDPQKKGWHDHLSGSYVFIEKKGRTAVVLLFLVTTLIIEGLLLSNLIKQFTNNQILIQQIYYIRELYQKKEIQAPIPIDNIYNIEDEKESNIDQYITPFEEI